MIRHATRDYDAPQKPAIDKRLNMALAREGRYRKMALDYRAAYERVLKRLRIYEPDAM